MFMPRTQTPRLGEAVLGGGWVGGCKGSVQHKCLGENESDGWRGICREVCRCVPACLCVAQRIPPPPPRSPPLQR